MHLRIDDERAPAPAVRPHLAPWYFLIVYGVVRAFWSVSATSWTNEAAVEALIKLVLWVAPCAIAIVLIDDEPPRVARERLGIGGSPWRGLAFALAATAPMAFALVTAPFRSRAVDFDLLLDAVFIGPFAEEVLFRGFLCWQLVRRAGWSAPWAIGASSVCFGLAHLINVDGSLIALIQGPRAFPVEWTSMHGVVMSIRMPPEVWLRVAESTVQQLVLQAAPYALGGALFAWVAWRWQSLWPAIFLHAGMNLWWVLAAGGDTSLAFDLSPMSVAHGTAVAMAVALTMVAQRPGFKFQVRSSKFQVRT